MGAGEIEELWGWRMLGRGCLWVCLAPVSVPMCVFVFVICVTENKVLRLVLPGGRGTGGGMRGGGS